MESNEILAAFYAAYNRADVDAAVAMYAPDGRHVEIAQGREARGREEIAEGLRAFLTSFPDAEWKVERSIVDGNRAAATYRLTGTLRARLGPFEPNSQSLDLRGVHVFELAGGAIAVTEDYWDASTFGRQMRRTDQGS